MSGSSAPFPRLAAMAALFFNIVRVPLRPHGISRPSRFAGVMGGLPGRDLWLLPLIFLATVFVLLFASELGARIVWPEQERDLCEMASGHLPNCVSRVKTAEGPWVTYRYNACGWRGDYPCAPRPAGALRAAVIGTSISFGAWVPFRQTFSGRLESALTNACGRPVDFQVDTVVGIGGSGGAKWSRTAGLAAPALASKPQVLVTVMAPFDLEEYVPKRGVAPAARVSRFTPRGIKSAFKGLFANSRAVHMAQHIFYLDLARYIPLYLWHGDAADFLRPPFTPTWSARLAFADQMLGRIADEAHKAAIPFIVVFMPNRVEAALSAAPRRGTDAFALPNALAAIAHRHGAIFADVTQLTKRMKRQDGLFYPVDGHPTAAGHALIARALRRALQSVPAFSACRRRRRRG